jgi:tetratricopeptide (TPR) repeat protein
VSHIDPSGKATAGRRRLWWKWNRPRPAGSGEGDAARRAAWLRILRRAALALPALLIIVGVPALIPMLRADPSAIRRRYEALTEQAQKAKDAATADICLDRLTLLKTESGFGSPEFILKLAEQAYALKQIGRTEVLLDEIAPDDRAVHAPAHYMRAMLLLRGPEEGKGPTKEDRLRAERHLRLALERDPDLAPAHEVLGLIAVQAGEPARAEAHLQRAVTKNPALSYQVAALLHNQGRTAEATAWAGKARDFLQPLIDKNPDDHAARLLLASSELILKNRKGARDLLLRGLARADVKEFRQLLANSYLEEAATLGDAGSPDPGARLPLFEQALRYDPDNAALAEQLSAILKGDGAEAARLREQLLAAVSEGRALTTAHLLLGYDAWERGRAAEAQLHWERALEANPNSPLIANNLAWALASGPTPDLDRALSLIDAALAGSPKEPTLKATRGRILVRLKRWKEALTALEAALPAQPDDRELHADLAEVYTALGSPDLAARHKRLAESPAERPAAP